MRAAPVERGSSRGDAMRSDAMYCANTCSSRPGAKYPYYFEDVYLARYLGYSLVEGADLAVRDDRVFLKTLAGLVPIDVILSRGVERGVDPLELGGGEPHGIPGLLKVIREGKVTVANVPGSGLVESPIFMAFLPQLCRRLSGRRPAAAVDCHLVVRRSGAVSVSSAADLPDLVIKPAFQASGGEEIIAGRLDAGRPAEACSTRSTAQPYDYVAQELIARSAVPVFHHGDDLHRTCRVPDVSGGGRRRLRRDAGRPGARGADARPDGTCRFRRGTAAKTGGCWPTSRSNRSRC